MKTSDEFLWICIPVLLAFFPVIISIVSIFVNIWWYNILGFYYLESIFLSFLALYVCILYRRKIFCIVMIAGLLSLGMIILLTFTHTYFQSSLMTTSDPEVFLKDAMNSNNWLLTTGFKVHVLLSTDTRIQGLLGIIFGLLSVYVMYIGSHCRVEPKNARTLLGSVSFLSIIIAVMLFALQAGPSYLLPLRQNFALAAPLLLSAFCLCFGFLAYGRKRNRTNRDPFLLFIGGIISFAMGFTVGSLTVPITRVAAIDNADVPIVFNEDQAMYWIFPGAYFLMCLIFLFVGVFSYILSDNDSPLYKIAKKHWG